MSTSVDVATPGSAAIVGWQQPGQPRWRATVSGYLLFAPAFLLVAGTLLYPLLYGLALSFTDASQFAGWGRFVGLRNYAQILADAAFWRAAATTALLTVAITAIEIALGCGAALLMWHRSWLRPLLFVVALLPWAMPSTLANWAWYWMMLPPFPTFYTLDAVHVQLAVDAVFGDQAYAILAFAISSTWRGSAIVSLILLAGFNAMPSDLLDYGRLDAPSALRLFWHVMLPLCRRFVVLAALVAVVITYMDLFSIHIQRGGQITVPLLAILAYKAWIQSGNTAYAAALSMLELPVTVTLAVVGLWLLESRSSTAVERESASEHGRVAAHLLRRAPGQAPTAGRASLPRRRPLVSNVALSLGCLLLAVFYVIPLYYTFVNSVDELNAGLAAQNPFWIHKWDWQDGWADDLGDVLVWDSAANTLLVYGAVLIIGLGTSLAAAYALVRYKIKGAPWLARLMFASYFVPQAVVVLPLFQVYKRVGLYNTLTGLVVIDLTLAIPFATWLFYVYFVSLDPELEEAASLDTGPLRTFLYVVLPRSLPVLATAAMFTVGMITSDVVYNGVLAIDPSVRTLPVYLGTIGFDPDYWPDANADVVISTLPFAILFLMLGVYYVDGIRQAFGGDT